MIFKEQLNNISTVLNNTGNTTQLLTSFSALDVAQQKVLLSSKLLTEEQKVQCATMMTLSSANTKYTAEQLMKATSISSETLATWGLTEATDTLTISQLAEMASSDAQAKTVLEKIVAQNAQAVANGEVTASNIALTASEGSVTLATGAFTTAIKANISAMKTWLLTTPAGWLTALVGVIFIAVKAYKEFVPTAEKANEKINESRSTYEETTSTLESMNSELENTKKRINELESKGSLSFTDKAEIDNLRDQNAELERSISLLEKKRQNEAKQTVVDIKQNKDTLDKDFDESLNNLSLFKKEYDETRQAGIKGMSQGTVTLENYEATMASYDKMMGQYEASVIENIEKYEQYKQDIINKYGTDDTTKFNLSDKNLYDNIVNQLQDAYKLIYSDSEYNKFVIEPIFDDDKLKGLQDELLSYFMNGGSTDLSALEERFGSDIITALRNACAKAGIDFDKMIGDIYNNSQSKINQIAPIVTIPTGAYDAKQNSISKQIRDYIQNDLSEEDRTILLNAEIPDDVKFRIKQDVDNYIASLKADVDTDETDISSFSDAWASLDNATEETLKNTKSELTKLAEAGQLTEESFNNTTGADTFLNQIGLSASEAIIKINELVNSSSQLSTMGKQISAMSDALATKSSEGFVDTDTLSGFDASVRGLETWDDFEEKLGDSTSSMEDCQNAANALATEYVNSNNFLSRLTDANKDYYITQLQKMGVDNAAEVVANSLKNQEEALANAEIFVAQKKRENADSSYTLANATASEIQKFAEETNMSSSAATSLLQLALKKQLVNGTTLDFSGDIANIRSLVSAIGGATSALSSLAAMKAANGTGGMPSSVANKIKSNAQKEIDNALNKGTTKVNVNSGGVSSGGGGGGGGGSKKDTSKTKIDWIARKLERLQKIIDMTKAKFENLFDLKSKSSNLDTQIKQTTNLLKANQKAADKYKKYADKVKLSKDLKKKVREGNYSIKDYSSKTADKINKYKEYYDNYKEAQQQAEELKTTLRDLKEEKYQLYVDDAEANIDKLNAQKDIAVGYANQNSKLDAQKAYLKQSHDYQWQIAELTKDKVKQDQLDAEYQKQLRDLEKEKFENIKTYYENEVSLIENQFTSLDNKISEIEASGANVNKAYYESQKKINDNIKKSYEDEKTALESQLPYITKGTQAWYDAQDAIQECDNAISDCVKTTYELNNAINELHFKMFDDIADGIDRVITEQEFLQSLFAHEKNTNSETGGFTEAGIAKLGSTAANYYLAKGKQENYQKILKDLEDVEKNGRQADGSYKYGDFEFGSEIALLERKNEVIKKIQDSTKEAYDYESNLADMMKEKYQAELDLLDELIKKKSDALQAEKDLRDYSRNIAEKSKNITTLQKQLSALTGDSSQEGMAKKQKLQVELTKAIDDREQTEYERAISTQTDMLEKLSQEANELVEKKLDDFMTLVDEALGISNEKTSNIDAFLQKVATDNGYSIEKVDGKSIFELKDGEETLSDRIKNLATAIENKVVDLSGTKDKKQPENTGGSNNGNASPTFSTTDKDKILSNGLKQIESKTLLNPVAHAIADGVYTNSKSGATAFIKNKATKATKKKSEYSAVNQKVYNLTKGKVLSTDNMKELAKIVGVKYNNAGKSGNLYKKLKSLKVSGFKRGGVVAVDDIEEQVKANGDSVLGSFNPGERILTPVQNDLFEKFVNNLPELNQMTELLKPVVDLPKMPEIQRAQQPTQNNIQAEYNFTLENCTNAQDIINCIKKDQKVQRALRAVTTDEVMGKGRLGVNKIR